MYSAVLPWEDFNLRSHHLSQSPQAIDTPIDTSPIDTPINTYSSSDTPLAYYAAYSDEVKCEVKDGDFYRSYRSLYMSDVADDNALVIVAT